jgi:hypothetical protein
MLRWEADSVFDFAGDSPVIMLIVVVLLNEFVPAASVAAAASATSTAYAATYSTDDSGNNGNTYQYYGPYGKKAHAIVKAIKARSNTIQATCTLTI